MFDSPYKRHACNLICCHVDIVFLLHRYDQQAIFWKVEYHLKSLAIAVDGRAVRLENRETLQK